MCGLFTRATLASVARVLAVVVYLSVCLPVCLSVTLRWWIAGDVPTA